MSDFRFIEFTRKALNFKRGLHRYLSRFSGRGNVCIFGVGHKSVIFIDFYNLHGVVKKAFDDNVSKLGAYFPGSRTVLISSPRLTSEDVVCLVAIPDKHMPALEDRFASWLSEGGKFLSIFPSSSCSVFNEVGHEV